ncbi:hypothetical protein SUGI_0308630 [Cryptomeria japonica]|nr:hypothetical protein SUGI_0308630 [Cryptomeria japonica]
MRPVANFACLAFASSPSLPGHLAGGGDINCGAVGTRTGAGSQLVMWLSIDSRIWRAELYVQISESFILSWDSTCNVVIHRFKNMACRVIHTN